MVQLGFQGSGWETFSGADLQDLPGYLGHRVARQDGRLLAWFTEGTAPNEVHFRDWLKSKGLSLECYQTGQENSGFRDCLAAQRKMGKAASFNTCSTPVDVCDGDSLEVLPWGPGSTILFCPDPPRNPEYDPFSAPSPWVNPWLSGTNYGCLLSGEQNTIWLRITVTTPGQLEWAFLFPEEDAFFNFIYMDWSLFEASPTICSDIVANNALSAPVRCNWNDIPQPPQAATGMVLDSNSIPVPFETDNFELSLPVLPGDQFLLLLDNWSGGTFDGVFDFSLSPNSAGICTIILPEGYTELQAAPRGEGVDLQWFQTSQLLLEGTEVQRSSDGDNFQTLYHLSPEEFASGKGWTDTAPIQGTNFYRLRSFDRDGQEILSNVVETVWEGLALQVYPHPVQDGRFALRSSIPLDNLRIFDASGKMVYSHHWSTEVVWQAEVHPDLERGWYLLEVEGPSGTRQRQALLVR